MRFSPPHSPIYSLCHPYMPQGHVCVLYQTSHLHVYVSHTQHTYTRTRTHTHIYSLLGACVCQLRRPHGSQLLKFPCLGQTTVCIYTTMVSNEGFGMPINASNRRPAIVLTQTPFFVKRHPPLILLCYSPRVRPQSAHWTTTQSSRCGTHSLSMDLRAPLCYCTRHRR